MRAESWSQHIPADNKTRCQKSVKSQSMLFRETLTTSNEWQQRLHFPVLCREEEAFPGNDVLALQLI